MSDSNAKKEIYISDLFEFSKEKDRIVSYSSKNKWECVSYETSVTKGKLLVASDKSNPPPLTLVPGLSGWYRIYVCMGELTAPGNLFQHIDIKLSGDDFPRTVSPCRMGPYTMWSKAENVEESFWKCADMTNQDIIISKPDLGYEYTASLFWFRFVRMTDDEVNESINRIHKRTMIAHMDGDFHLNDVSLSPRDYCKQIYPLIDSDIGILCQEVTNDIIDYKHPSKDYVHRSGINAQREKLYHELSKNRNRVYPVQIDYAHKYGIKMFAAHRMQLSNFSFPFAAPFFHIKFVEDHKELRCKARDGSYIDFLSYGYKATQDFMIKAVLDSVKNGFDGILCIWTRGISLGFEEPVKELYQKKYGQTVDIVSLPEDDDRLVKIKCDIMTNFHRRLKRAISSYLKRHNIAEPKIYITGCYDVQSSKITGIDIERLAKGKLIDGVIQTKMKMTEDTHDVLGANGMIDVNKYTAKARTGKIYERTSGSRIDLLTEGTKEYRKTADKYGIDYHTEIQWEGLKKPEEYVSGAKQILSSYGKGISLWDCCPTITQTLSEWSAVSHLGDGNTVLTMSESPEQYHRIYRVLSYNDIDIRIADPSWRG